jgi:hypothetical protein
MPSIAAIVHLAFALIDGCWMMDDAIDVVVGRRLCVVSARPLLSFPVLY